MKKIKFCSVDFCKDCQYLGIVTVDKNKEIYSCGKTEYSAVFGHYKEIFEEQKRPENCVKDRNHKQIELPFRRVKCNRQTI